MLNMFYGFGPALWTETKKVMRSRTFWFTALGMVLLTCIVGLFTFIMKDPEQARRMGLLGAKAQFFGTTADWSSLFNLILTLMSVGGLIIFGFVFVWIFGREFSDKTVYDLLALPVSRLAVVLAKCVTALIWSAALLVLCFVLLLALGGLIGLPGWSGAAVGRGLGYLMATGALTVILCLPFSFIASATRSYLPALGGIFLIIILSQVITQLGNGAYFPWTVPMLFSGAAEALSGKTAEPLGAVSYIIVGVTALISLAALVWWWQKADQS